jgi:signal transduction histidine kinase/ligand-binding sensor domain-containing protein
MRCLLRLAKTVAAITQRLGERTSWIALFILCGLWFSSTAAAQHVLSPPGLPVFLEHFTGQDYRGLPQNWSVAQDTDGLIYVGNRDGVLVYDGQEWTVVPVSNGSTVRSLASGPDGRIYFGAQGEFGYIRRADSGLFDYVSLADSLDADVRDFADDVWATHVLDADVYFQTRDRIFRWTGNQEFVIHQPAETFRTAFATGGKYFVRDRGRGLLVEQGDDLVLLPGGNRFSDVQVFLMHQRTDGSFIIGTREEGMLLFDGARYVSFAPDANEWLRENRLYSGSVADGYVVLGTLGGGIAVLTDTGRLVQILDEDLGLPDGWINYIHTDNQGGVWLALHNRGLLRVDIPSQLTVFDDRTGLSGMINNIARDFRGLVVSTNSGLYQLETTVSRRAGDNIFRRVPAVDVAYSFLAADDLSLVGTNLGIDVHYASGHYESLEIGEVHSITEAPRRNAYYVATSHGVVRLTRDAGSLRSSRVGDISERISSVVVDDKDRIWALSRTGTMYRAEYVGEGYAVRRYTAEDGVPGGDGLIRYGDEIGIVTPSAVLRFVGDDVEGPAFQPDARFYADAMAPLNNLRSLIEDDQGRIWLVRSDRVDILTKDGHGGFIVTSPPELAFPEWNTTQVFVDRDGVVWLTNDYKLYRYDATFSTEKTYAIDVPPVLRHVTLVESGTRLASASPAMTPAGMPVIDHRDNAIRFDFALPSYNEPALNEYQFYLEGHDRGWSDWSRVSNKSYTNLREGRYRFRVRGRNGQGMVSPEAVYTFKVNPPWFRTMWAYLAYLTLISVFVAFVVQYRRLTVANRRAQRQAEELERERSVNERLQESYNRLQEANQSLLQADKLKDEFLANTSHELRTPLTAILGFASILKDEVEGEHQEFMGMIEENGKRLLHTLNSLLDLAKLRVGMMETDMQPLDVTTRVHEVAKLMMPLARRKNIDLDVRAPSSAVFALLDANCVERVLYNLVGNAIKFTDEGSVTILVEESGDDVVISVRDTGIGIDEQFIPQLFNEFRQESAGLTREHEGSGLGLAITNRLVQLMNGTIAVTSEKGVGSVFVVRFPQYHRNDGERVPVSTKERVSETIVE